MRELFQSKSNFFNKFRSRMHKKLYTDTRKILLKNEKGQEIDLKEKKIFQSLPWKGIVKDIFFLKEIDTLMTTNSVNREHNYFKRFSHSYRRGLWKFTQEGGVSAFQGVGGVDFRWLPLPDGITLDGRTNFPVIEKALIIGTAYGYQYKKHDLWLYNRPVNSTGEVSCFYKLHTHHGTVGNDYGIWGVDIPDGIPMNIVHTAHESVEQLGKEAGQSALYKLQKTSDQQAIFTALINVILLSKLSQNVPSYFQYRDAKFPVVSYSSYVLFDSIKLDLLTGRLEVYIQELGLGLTVRLLDNWPLTLRANISGTLMINPDQTITHDLKWTGPYNGVPQYSHNFSNYLPTSIPIPIDSKINWDNQLGNNIRISLLQNYIKNAPHFVSQGFLPALNLARQLSLDSLLEFDTDKADVDANINRPRP